MTAVEGILRRPFAEQIAAFRLRSGTLVPTRAWSDLWKDQHDRAFMVAGAMKADLLADLAKAVDKAISKGTSLEEFRRDFRQIVETRGWHGWTGEETAQGRAWRTRVIYQTNMRTSYAAGRYAQLMKGGFKYWIYRHGGSADPRIVHLGWDGLVLPFDHPFWAKHFPPNDWGCSCYVIGARSLKGARLKGGDPDKQLEDGWQMLDAKTGEPHGIGKGWGYTPGATALEDIARIAAEIRKGLPPQLGDALVKTVKNPPAPPATDAPLIREARSLKDAADLAFEAGLTKNRVNWPSKADLAGVNQVLKAIAETEARFDFVQMQAFGSAGAIAKQSPIRNSTRAAAWYHMRYQVMGWNNAGLSTRRYPVSEELQKKRSELHAKKVDLLPEGPAKEAARKAEFLQFSASRLEAEGLVPKWTAIHETGHRFHSNFFDEVNEVVRDWRSGHWYLAVSQYGATNREEFVAESFVLYMMGPEFHDRIKPELLAVFKRKDRYVD